MILDSFDHAEEDFAKRLLIEARNEAETILAKVEQARTSPAWEQLTRRRAVSAIDAARDRLAAVKRGRRSDRYSRRDAGSRPRNAALCRVDDGCRGDHRDSRQDHGRSRRRSRRGSHRAASHGPGGIQMIAEWVPHPVVGWKGKLSNMGHPWREFRNKSAEQIAEEIYERSKHTRTFRPTSWCASPLCPKARRSSSSSARCPTTITASRCRFSMSRRTSASFSTTPAAASAPAPPATSGSRTAQRHQRSRRR